MKKGADDGGSVNTCWLPFAAVSRAELEVETAFCGAIVVRGTTPLTTRFTCSWPEVTAFGPATVNVNVVSAFATAIVQLVRFAAIAGSAFSASSTSLPEEVRSRGAVISEPSIWPSLLISIATVNWPCGSSSLTVPCGAWATRMSISNAWSAGAAPHRWLRPKIAWLALSSFHSPRPRVPTTSVSRVWWLLYERL